MAVDSKPAQIADRSEAIPCKRKANPYQFGIDPVLDQSSFPSCKRGLRDSQEQSRILIVQNILYFHDLQHMDQEIFIFLV